MNARLVMLYDLIRDFKADMNKRFEETNKKIDKNSEEIRHLTERIDYLYLNRDKVKISFSKTFAFGTVLFSGLFAYVLALFGTV